MAYITLEDMVKAFGFEEIVALTNIDDPDAVEINVDILNVAIDDASASIDAYLQGRYTVPVVPTPSFLKRIACDFARGLLDQNSPREEVVRRWEQAIAMLKDIAKGTASLPIPNGGATGGDPQYSLPDFISAPPVFTRENLEGF